MQISPILWLAAAVGFLALEASTFNMTSIWFAIGSAAALLCCVFTGSFRVQAVVFLVVSILCLAAFRPLAAKAKQLLTDCGAVAAMMSGSGPTVFGIFADAQTRDAAARVLARHGYRPKPADFTHGKSKK